MTSLSFRRSSISGSHWAQFAVKINPSSKAILFRMYRKTVTSKKSIFIPVQVLRLQQVHLPAVAQENDKEVPPRLSSIKFRLTKPGDDDFSMISSFTILCCSVFFRKKTCQKDSTMLGLTTFINWKSVAFVNEIRRQKSEI